MCVKPRKLNVSGSLPAPSSIVGCKIAKLDQPRLLGMQSQIELGESFLQILVKPLGVRPVLKSNDEVICKSDDNHVASRFCLSPLVHPEIEHVVQKDICHQWRATPPCGVPSSLLFHRPSSSTPAFNHFRIKRTTRWSAIRCSMNSPATRVDTIEERADVPSSTPVHLLRQYSDVQGIQRIVLPLPAES